MEAALDALVPAVPPAEALVDDDVDVVSFVTVPAGALVVCAPLALPPDVLM